MAAAYLPTVLLHKFSYWPLREIFKDSQIEILSVHFTQNMGHLKVKKRTEI